MMQKNYMSKGEQIVWEYLKDKEIIDTELLIQIFPEMPENKRDKLLHTMHKKGYLKRARKGLYYNPLKLKDFHKLALLIKDGYICLSSALRHHNLIEYEDFTIFVATKKFRKTVLLEGTKYEIKFVPFGTLFTGFVKHDGIYVSTIEKTLFDCLAKPGLVGFSNITKAFYDAKLDWKKFTALFRLTKNKALFQRTGYILEMLKKETHMKVPDFVFDFLSKKTGKPTKLAPLKGRSVFDKKWKVQDNAGKKALLSWWY